MAWIWWHKQPKKSTFTNLWCLLLTEVVSDNSQTGGAVDPNLSDRPDSSSRICFLHFSLSLLTVAMDKLPGSVNIFWKKKKIVINDITLCPPGEAFSQHLTHDQQVHNVSISVGFKWTKVGKQAYLAQSKSVSGKDAPLCLMLFIIKISYNISSW